MSIIEKGSSRYTEVDELSDNKSSNLEQDYPLPKASLASLSNRPSTDPTVESQPLSNMASTSSGSRSELRGLLAMAQRQRAKVKARINREWDSKTTKFICSRLDS